jgi:hypothetical protein
LPVKRLSWKSRKKAKRRSQRKSQRKGLMRPLVETAFEVAKQGNLPVIVSTDAKLKKDKYEHIGMKLNWTILSYNLNSLFMSCF